MTISAILTPLPTNSQAVSHLAGKKTLARFSYTGLVAVSHRVPFHHIHLPFQSSFPPPLFPGRTAQALHPFSLESLTLQTIPQITRTVTLWEQELFSELDDCGRINPTTCRTNLPGMSRLLSRPAEALTAWLDAPLASK